MAMVGKVRDMTQTMAVEAMASAIADDPGWEWTAQNERTVSKAARILAALEARRFVVVPVMATEEMLSDGFAAVSVGGPVREVWAAMLAARPKSRYSDAEIKALREDGWTVFAESTLAPIVAVPADAVGKAFADGYAAGALAERLVSRLK